MVNLGGEGWGHLTDHKLFEVVGIFEVSQKVETRKLFHLVEETVHGLESVILFVHADH
jgi:hypothetical protein